MKKQFGYTIFEVLQVLIILSSLALTGLMIYGVIHFALKFW